MKHSEEEKLVENDSAVLLTMTVIKEDTEGNVTANGDYEKPSRGSSILTLENGSVDTLQTTASEKTLLGRIKVFVKKLYKGLKSLIGLLIILIVYSLLGGLIFMLVESPHEEAYKGNISATRQNMINQLFNLTRTVNHVTWENKAREFLVKYEADIMEAYKNDVGSPSTEKVWDFWTSLFFCGTIYTTIGYGNIAPATDFGRVLTIFYAAIGIPIALLLLAELGKRFTVPLKFLWAFVRRFYYTGYCRKKVVQLSNKGKYGISRRFRKKSDDTLDQEKGSVKEDREKTPTSEEHLSSDHSELSGQSGDEYKDKMTYHGYEIDDNFNVPIAVAIGMLVIYIFLGAIMYCIWEEWTFLESFYFVFISISTIGFGDITPAHPKYFLISYVYIFIGLSLLSMCVNVAIEFFAVTVDKAKVTAKRKISQAKHKVTEVGKAAGKAAKEKASEAKGRVSEVGKSAKDKVSGAGKSAKEKVSEAGKSAKNKVTKAGKNLKTDLQDDVARLKAKIGGKGGERKGSGSTVSSEAGGLSRGVSDTNVSDRQQHSKSDDSTHREKSSPTHTGEKRV